MVYIKSLEYIFYQNDKIVEYVGNDEINIDKTNKKIIYICNNFTNLICYKKDYRFERYNNEYKFVLNISKKTATLKIKKFDEMMIKVSKINYRFEKDLIEIEYQLETMNNVVNKIVIIGKDII